MNSTSSKLIFGAIVVAALFLTLKAKCNHSSTNVDENITIKIGSNIKLSTHWENLPLVEPHISVHPTDTNILLVAAQLVNDIDRPYESCQLITYTSRDGGQTWLEKTRDWYGYDPWSTILDDGSTIISWIGNESSFQHSFPIRLFYSGPTGQEEVQTLPGNHDGTKLTTVNNQTYFTTVKFREDMGADVVLYSHSGHGKFEYKGRINGNGVRLNFCEPAVLNDGTVLVPYSHYLEDVWVRPFDPSADIVGGSVKVSSRSGGARGYMSFVADNSPTSDFEGQVYFVRALGRSADHKGVWINYSSDKGKTWSQDRRVDRFQNSHASLATVATNNVGTVLVSWVDSQLEKDKNDVYCSASVDGGLSFSRPFRVTNESSNPRTNSNGDAANKFYSGGHYMSIASKSNGLFQLIWSDSRTGVFQLYTTEVVVSVPKKL